MVLIDSGTFLEFLLSSIGNLGCAIVIVLKVITINYSNTRIFRTVQRTINSYREDPKSSEQAKTKDLIDSVGQFYEEKCALPVTHENFEYFF